MADDAAPASQRN